MRGRRLEGAGRWSAGWARGEVEVVGAAIRRVPGGFVDYIWPPIFGRQLIP